MSSHSPEPLSSLPVTFAATRAGLHAVACFVLSPARKQATGRIGLTPTPGGFGTLPFGPRRRRVRVEGDELVIDEATAPPFRHPLTTVAAAAGIVGVALSPDPGVGHDLPPFAPEDSLAVDAEASLALGAWYAFAEKVMGELRASLQTRGPVSEIQLWPEHFDLAFDHRPPEGRSVNLGASPGDAFSTEHYLYVGPWERAGLDEAYWNAPFGAVLTYSNLLGQPDLAPRPGAEPEPGPGAPRARAFFDRGVALLSG